jgi:hypothetical protein
MKMKILGIGSLLTLALAFAGCGDNSQPTPAPATKPAATTPAIDVAALKASADKWLADIKQAITDKKWDVADKGVAELNKLKPNLPADYAAKIDDLKKALDAAKALTKPALKIP